MHLPGDQTSREPCGVVRLADGPRVALRRAGPGDDERLRRLFYRLSPVTVYWRLFRLVPRTPYWADTFAALARADADTQRQAVVALVEGEIVGLANYGRHEAGPEGPKRGHAQEAAGGAEAEVAIVVDDAWQRRGVGRLLVTCLAHVAAEHGISHFIARMHAENAGARHFVQRLFPGACIRWTQGEFAARLPLACRSAREAP